MTTIDIRKANPIERVIDRLGSIELLGVVFSPGLDEGVVLYKNDTETICHLFDRDGYTFHGSYSGSGDDPALTFSQRASTLVARG